MQIKRTQDIDITSSSELSSNHAPAFARLDGPRAFWSYDVFISSCGSLSQIRALRLLCTRYVTGKNLGFQCSGSIRPIKKMFSRPRPLHFWGWYLLIITSSSSSSSSSSIVVVVIVIIFFNLIYIIILLRAKFLQFDWLRAVVFPLNLKYLHVKITNLLRVAV